MPKGALRAGFRVRAFPRTLAQGGSAARWKRCRATTRTLIGVPQRAFGRGPRANYLAACKALENRLRGACEPKRALFLAQKRINDRSYALFDVWHRFSVAEPPTAS